METPQDGGRKVCLNGPDHMTKMDAIAIYDKTPLKIFFSRTRRPIALMLGMWHWGCGAHQVCSIDCPKLDTVLLNVKAKYAS